MKKSIKYAGIAAATLLAVAPIAAPALASNVTVAQAADNTDTLKANLASAKSDLTIAQDKLAEANKTAAADTTVAAAQKVLDAANAANAANAASPVVPADVTKAQEDLDAAKAAVKAPVDAAQKDVDTAQSAVDAAQKDVDTAQSAVDAAQKATGKTDYLSDSAVQTRALNKFNGQFGDQTASTFSKNTYLNSVKDLTNANKYSYNAFMSSSVAYFLNNNDNNSSAITLDSENVNGIKVNLNDALSQANGKVGAGNMRDIYVTAKVGNTVLKTQTELRNVLKDNTQKEVVFTINYTYTDTEGAEQTGSTTVTATRPTDGMTKVSADFTTPYKVALNQTVTDSKLTSATDFSLVDQDGKSLLADSYANPSDSYYHTASGALNNTNPINDSSIIETGKTSDGGNAKADVFKKAGNYYQAITVKTTTSSALYHFIEAAKQDPDNNPFYINGTLFKGINTSNFNETTNDSDVTLTFAREINVSNSTSSWTTTDQKGVVTTKSDKNYYTLVNTDGTQEPNRALAKNSAWITDKVRTDQNGNKQYRVSTDEWIDADSVTFSDKATTPSTGALTDITPVDGKVTTAGPASFLYLLYSADGKQSSRALPGLSAWRTDKKATDANGNTVYRVSTDEWVIVDGAKAVFTAY
ncbi:hypothetical protein [Companilactobacillus kimchiensis]|uniref:Surface layer protein A domain-containing protein n=1 Tax=Companilactobacillus kimchiensis TaxID=993692 RepID=A0A0R2LLD6_9LACO|nr:hypothetical protein [Companilactobacillus kimchiensis]KRO00322.1 hypothetical protein IV57_GL001425 [Companilactobacillus kimchiensis]